MSTLAKAIAASIMRRFLIIDNAESRKQVHLVIVEEFSKLPIGSELRLKLDEKQRPFLELAVGNDSGRLTEIF